MLLFRVMVHAALGRVKYLCHRSHQLHYLEVNFRCG